VPLEDLKQPESAEHSHFGLLLLCFFLSGLAALIYQTAWTRQFAFVFGTSELSVASVLAAYMGGLAVGAAAIGRIAPRVRRPILVYGILELAIGLAALAVPLGVRLTTHLYVAVFGGQNAPADEGGLLSALFYLVCSFGILLIPTALMGATLPLLARHAVRREEEIGSRIARLYAMNTAGAVAGTVLTGFLLLPAFGLSLTVWIAVATNGAVFAAAAVLAMRAPAVATSKAPVGAQDPRSPNGWILPLIAVSGAVSFTYEVLWTRLLGHLLGGSVYAFATMLATFLTGIALGSALASGRLTTNRRTATSAFAWVQIGTGLLSLAAYVAIDSTPGWISALAVKGDLRLLADAGISAAILLPGALCIGATFPLAVRILARSQEEAARAAARVYSWNTVGAITGAVGAGFFLIPAVGFAWTIVIAVATNAALAAATALRTHPRPLSVFAAALAACGVLAFVRPEPPWQLLRVGAISGRVKPGKVIHFAVGRGATVMLQDTPGGFALSSNGLPEATIHPPGVRIGRSTLARWLGSLPSWGRPDARSILVVGLGGGLVVEAMAPTLERIDVVEIEPEVIRANELLADARWRDPLADPRIELIVNDARSALLLTNERYDAIVSQPSHPWTASASHLYTREFFELAKSHLADDGVFVQWMGLGFIDEELLRTLVATLLDVFPHVRVYQPAPGGLLFSASAVPFEPEREIGAALRTAANLNAELGIYGGEDIVALLVLDEGGAREFAKGGAVNTDDRNLLQMNSPKLVRNRRRLKPGPILAPFDPLQRGPLEWDRSYLIRRLLSAGLVDRAQRLATSATDPAEKHVASALLANSQGRPSVAVASFRRALEEDATNEEAQIGLLQTLRVRGAKGKLGVEPTRTTALIVESWKLLDAEDWQALKARDSALAEVEPHHPAFGPATRLRVRWRLTEGGTDPSQAALQLLDEMLPVAGATSDLTLRARAAAGAGYPGGAVSSIQELLQKLGRGPATAPLVLDALKTVRALPPDQISDEQRKDLHQKLSSRLPKT
jgi:spermidine synthase